MASIALTLTADSLRSIVAELQRLDTSWTTDVGTIASLNKVKEIAATVVEELDTLGATGTPLDPNPTVLTLRGKAVDAALIALNPVPPGAVAAAPDPLDELRRRIGDLSQVVADATRR